jgi:ubiquinone/menaquinone biosynthesis C-methylase UbiE
MTAEYDNIAENYKQAKQHAWRRHIEAFTFFELLGDLRGKSMLDLACGEGFYTRQLQDRGASRLVGVDLSERMIGLAREEESRHPRGIEYHVADAGCLDLDERFDLVTAAYLFNYASTREQLLDMCRTAWRHLKPGGRLVAINDNQDQPIETFGITRKYGLTKSPTGPLTAGAPITFTIYSEGGSFEFVNYYLGSATYESAFAEAGFTQFRWHLPRLSPAGECQFGADYWADFLNHPCIVFIECRK